MRFQVFVMPNRKIITEKKESISTNQLSPKYKPLYMQQGKHCILFSMFYIFVSICDSMCCRKRLAKENFYLTP